MSGDRFPLNLTPMGKAEMALRLKKLLGPATGGPVPRLTEESIKIARTEIEQQRHAPCRAKIQRLKDLLEQAVRPLALQPPGNGMELYDAARREIDSD